VGGGGRERRKEGRKKEGRKERRKKEKKKERELDFDLFSTIWQVIYLEQLL
jgi:hypothetical protein